MGSVKGKMLGGNCFMGFGHKVNGAKRDLTDLPSLQPSQSRLFRKIWLRPCKRCIRRLRAGGGL